MQLHAWGCGAHRAAACVDAGLVAFAVTQTDGSRHFRAGHALQLVGCKFVLCTVAFVMLLQFWFDFGVTLWVGTCLKKVAFAMQFVDAVFSQQQNVTLVEQTREILVRSFFNNGLGGALK